jgi:Domain of unknown function (DUF4386)
MTGRIAEASPRVKARAAGVFYFVTIVTASFAELGVRGNLIVSGDAAATARNMIASETLYRLGFVADLIAGAAYIVVTVLLYELLRPVNRILSLLAAFFSLVGVAIGAVTSLGNLAALLLVGGARYLSVFDAAQVQAMALLSLKLHAQGATVGLMFFGVYCLVLGYLIYKSTFLPRTVGVLMAIAGLSLLTNGFLTFLLPALPSIVSYFILGLDGVGEIALALWLLVFGVNVQKWEETSSVSRAGRA